MSIETWLRRMIAGRPGNWLDRSALVGLRLASLPVSGIVRLRNFAYDAGISSQQHAAVPVVSVGNLTLGGTGKTPIVEMIARKLRGRGRRVTILSRGYGSSDGPNDEALLLEENLPDVPHLQGADRCQLARIAVEELDAEILLLDDGMQHRRLARDLEIVVIDATDPWGGGWLLPGGRLREPLLGLRRANMILVSRADQVPERDRLAILERLGRWSANTPVGQLIFRADRLLGESPDPPPIQSLAGKKVLAVSGIGNPDSFERTLKNLGVAILERIDFPDHHPYRARDVERLADRARTLAADALVTTQKDLVKLRIASIGGVPVWGIGLSVDWMVGEDQLDRLLEGLAGDTDDVPSHRVESS